MGFSGPFPDHCPRLGVEEADPGLGMPPGTARGRRGDQPPVRADRRDPVRPGWSVGHLVSVPGPADGHRASRLSPPVKAPSPETSAPDRQEVPAVTAEGHGTDRPRGAQRRGDRAGPRHLPDRDRPVLQPDGQGPAVRPERQAPHRPDELERLPALAECGRIPQPDGAAFGAGREAIAVGGDRPGSSPSHLRAGGWRLPNDAGSQTRTCPSRVATRIRRPPPTKATLRMGEP